MDSGWTGTDGEPRMKAGELLKQRTAWGQGAVDPLSWFALEGRADWARRMAGSFLQAFCSSETAKDLRREMDA